MMCNAHPDAADRPPRSWCTLYKTQWASGSTLNTTALEIVLPVALLRDIRHAYPPIGDDADDDLHQWVRERLKFRSTDRPITVTNAGGNAGANPPIDMSDQNKNTGTTPGGTMNKPASTDNSSAAPNTDKREQAPTKAPSHEQGREHTPNVDAKQQAADVRRNAEVANGASDQRSTEVKPKDKVSERKEDEAGDAKRTVAEGQHNTKPGHDAAKPTGSTNTSGNR